MSLVMVTVDVRGQYSHFDSQPILVRTSREVFSRIGVNWKRAVVFSKRELGQEEGATELCHVGRAEKKQTPEIQTKGQGYSGRQSLLVELIPDR